MAPGFDPGTPGEALYNPAHNNSGGYQMEREHSNVSQNQSQSQSQNHPWQNDSRYTSSSALSIPDRDRERTDSFDSLPRPSTERKNSHQGSARSVSGQVRICNKCGEQLTGQFVRALEGTFHLECFRCQDCGEIVASKFFPADNGQYPLCERDYFRRLDLICYHCGEALRGSYITALDRKYHVDHFTCSICPTVFGAQDSYYEHDGQVYCHYHYSTQFAQRCNGCQTAILKQFVEIYRNGQNQHWHPECYMIHKFWNVRLTPPESLLPDEEPTAGLDETALRALVREKEERMEEKVYRIWSVLSTFEESSAACISDMLLHVSNGAYIDGVMVAKRFISHVEILFSSADHLDEAMTGLEMKSLSYSREAKLLCKKIVSFFSLLSRSQDDAAAKLGVTQELLSLVTSLAHYLKLLIRTCLQGALRIEKERRTSDGLYRFLDDIGNLESLKNEPEEGLHQLTSSLERLAAGDSDHCISCRKPIEDECAKTGEKRWHLACLNCSRCERELGRNFDDARFHQYEAKIYCNNCESFNSDALSPFEHITKLQEYVFLLRVALARLLDILRKSGALSRALADAAAEAAADGYDSVAKEELALSAEMQPQNYNRLSVVGGGGGGRDQLESSSYENTLNDIRRLRSTRLDKHLSSSFRKARTSRVMDGPEGSSARPGSSGGADGSGSNTGRPGLQIVEDRIDETSQDTMLGRQDALTLDDIPRIVAAKQARDKRPGAQGARPQSMFVPGDHSRGFASNERSLTGGLGRSAGPPANSMTPQKLGGRKYFSELSGLEYFILRHLAVLTMQPLVENEFTLEELLGLIESRKPATFWNKFGKAFKNDNKKNVKKKGIFGVPLEVIMERDGADSTDGVGPGTLRIPAIVDDIVSTMRKMDLSVEGVFRKNGNIKKLSELCEKIDRDGCDSVTLGSQNVVQVAALLKRYLRDLPDPLMTHKLYRLWLTAAKMNDENQQRQCLHLTCCLLPKCNRDCMEILFCFLKWAGSFHQVDDESGSKMDIKNLATVIAPNILFANTKTASLDSDPIYAIDAVDVLINNIEEMCLVPDDLVDILNDPSLFSNNGEITTKEILKRFGDRSANGAGGRPYGEFGEVVNRHDSATRPLARRVETDPAVWQEERSVRTVQDAPPPISTSVPPYGSSRSPNQSSSQWRAPEETQQTPPYAPQREYAASPNTSPSSLPPPQGPGPKREWRNSGWGRGNNGSVGVTGSG